MTETSEIHKALSHSSVETTQTKFGGKSFCHWIYNFLPSPSLFCCPIRNSNQMSWQVLSVRMASHALSLLALWTLFSLALAPPSRLYPGKCTVAAWLHGDTAEHHETYKKWGKKIMGGTHMRKNCRTGRSRFTPVWSKPKHFFTFLHFPELHVW